MHDVATDSDHFDPRLPLVDLSNFEASSNRFLVGPESQRKRPAHHSDRRRVFVVL